MSRESHQIGIYTTLVGGVDRATGHFIQVYDRRFIKKTPEGEGLIFDQDELFGLTIDVAGIGPISTNDKVEFKLRILNKINDFIASDVFHQLLNYEKNTEL